MSTYFIADLHLSELRPHTTELFLSFMSDKAKNAKAVYILGDLFDFWVGDDEQSSLITQVKQAIRNVTQLGVPCYFIHGNRDFLLGKDFATESGLILLPDYQVIDLYGQKALICHGDTFCVDDINYQKFRSITRQKWLQKLFLFLPLALRTSIAQKIRQKSEMDKKEKQESVMDVNEIAVNDRVAENDVMWVIHGHIHRQEVFIESTYSRIVLGDWDTKISALEVNEDGFDFV